MVAKYTIVIYMSKNWKGLSLLSYPADEKKEGFKILFDGTNMHQWTGNTTDYQLQDGCIALDPKGGHGGNLYTKDEFANFIPFRVFNLLPPLTTGWVSVHRWG